MASTDITFCSRECDNMECKRNLKHITVWVGLLSMCDFSDCKEYIKEEEDAE